MAETTDRNSLAESLRHHKERILNRRSQVPNCLRVAAFYRAVVSKLVSERRAAAAEMSEAEIREQYKSSFLPIIYLIDYCLLRKQAKEIPDKHALVPEGRTNGLRREDPAQHE